MDLKSTIVLVVLMFAGGAFAQNRPPNITTPSKTTVTLNIPEDRPLNQEIYRVVATDPDDNSTANGTVSYHFQIGNQERKFSMDASTGQIYLVMALDYEKINKYTLVVEATDGGGMTANCTVIINVINVNDNPPSCNPSLVWGWLSENKPAYTRFANVNCSDPETGKNYTLATVLGNSTTSRSDTIGASSVNNTAYNLRVTDFDAEPHSFSANVSVSDIDTPSLTSFITVILSQLDEDDNPPVFNQSSYSANVDENVELGYTILRLQATDKDDPNTPASRIAFVSVCVPDLLTIDISSGDLVVKKDINYDVVKTINCNVSASSVSSSKSVVSVVVTVINKNNGVPTFTQSLYIVSVYENASVSASIIQVTAIDPENDTITYSIEPGIFNITNTGMVTLYTSPDYETVPSYLVIINATDNGSPQKSSTTLLWVSINPVNEFKPVFVGTCNGSVPEDAAIGTSITMVTAYDNDTGLDGALFFAIQSSNVPFYMDQYSGLLGVAAELDYETQSNYNFVIVVSDNSTTTKRSATETCTILIIDVNDQSVVCAPAPVAVIQFPFPMYQEVASVNCSLGNRIVALNYNILSGNDGTFTLNPMTGKLTLQTIPQAQQYTLTIAVSYGADTTNTTLIIFAEQQLTFSNLPATINQTEEQPGRLLYTVTSCCVFPQTEYTITKGNEDTLVALTSSSGDLTLYAPYDREKKDTYIYVIRAVSKSGQIAISNLTVHVLDINDNTPKFPSSVYQIQLNENLPVSSYIDTYTATDADLGENKTLTYNITDGNIEGKFQIDNNGNLSLAQALNYDITPTYKLEITATDMGIRRQLASTTLVVVTVVRDSKPPELIPAGGNYAATLSEDCPLYTKVVQIQATNNKTNSNFIYSITSGNTNNAFFVDPPDGTIYTVRFLDRETTSIYSLIITATDQSGASVNGTVTVNITDVNDNNPIFIPEVQAFSIPDQTNPVYVVGVLNVTDPDYDLNGTVELTLDPVSNTANAFEINGFTLQTKIQMNYAAVNMYRLQVTATDKGTVIRRSTTTLIIVTVLNPNIPYFNKTSDTISLKEDTPIGFQVYDVNATDNGAVENGSFTYAIVSGNPGNFNINPISGGILIVKELDYNQVKNNYPLIVKATAQSGQTAQFTLTITVIQINKYSPQFDQYSVSFDVSEIAPPPTIVGTILATDNDQGSFGKVTEIMTGCSSFILLNPDTGVITVNGQLSYLTQQSYSCIITASDGGSPPKSDMASVVINVIDYNDHAPVFTSDTTVDVLDSVPVYSSIFQFIAYDLDTGDAGNISYEIVDPTSLNTFKLNKYTGILQTIVRLNALTKPQYLLPVRAFDAGNPLLDNFTTLTINVISTNPNYYAPVFPINSVSVNLKRTSAVGESVVLCSATDSDTGVSGVVQYTIISGNVDGYFIIDSSSGEITTATQLLTAQNTYTLSVMAKDGGTPSLNTTMTVYITVIPMLTQNITANDKFSIPENTAAGTLVRNITVNDSRTVSSYIISSGNYGDAFNILLDPSNNGKLFVKNPPDREDYPLFSLVIQVASDAGPLTIIVEVDITDVNDNDPVFTVTVLTLEIPECTPSGTSVGTVTVTDLDTDAQNRNNILSVAPPGVLEVDQTGKLTLKIVPDFETTPSYSLAVIATDQNSPYHTATLSVSITVIDIDEQEIISPSAVTNSSLISLEIPYQAVSGDLVYTLKPGDFSLVPGPSATIRFVAYKSTSPFSINQITGDITVGGTLSPKSKYFLWVMIQVSEGGATVSRITLIRVDTFDRNTELIVIEFAASYSYVQVNLQNFRNRAQTFFNVSQRIGFTTLVDSSTGSRRRLLDTKSAAYTYVVSNTSADAMDNINDPKSFMTQKQILNVLQNNPDGTPVLGLSDPSGLDVATVEPFEKTSSSSTSDNFDAFIKSPAGIAVFCLLGLFLLVLIILIVTCICYRKCGKNGRKSKKARGKDKPKKKNFSRMSENPSFFNSSPQIIVSAPPPVTLHNPNPEKPPSQPDETLNPEDDNDTNKQNTTNDKTAKSQSTTIDNVTSNLSPTNNISNKNPDIQSGLPSQYGQKDRDRYLPSRKSSNNQWPPKVPSNGQSSQASKEPAK